MNHEMEEHCGSCPQDTVDAAPETPRRGKRLQTGVLTPGDW